MFNYTQKWDDVDSSLIKGVFYNAPRREMLVRLDGDKQYLYDNVSETEAREIASAASPGAKYNWFRRWRGRGNGGTAVHNEVVVPSSTTPTFNTTTVVNGAVSATTYQPLSLTSKYEIEFTVDGGDPLTSTVKAANLVAAVTDVEQKLQSLGLAHEIVSAAKVS